jgi:hypothetical protein
LVHRGPVGYSAVQQRSTKAAGHDEAAVFHRTARVMYRVGCLIVAALGFAVCMAAYDPGVLSPDSFVIYGQAKAFAFSDHHAPMMALLWALLDHIVPGPRGMLLFLLALYWGGLLMLSKAAARINPVVAPLMVVLGFMPFAINFAGTLWVDVLLATSWLMSAAIVFSASIRGQPMSIARSTAAWTLFLIGAWARPNALFAAVPLGLYLLRPRTAFGFPQRAMLSVLLAAGLCSEAGCCPIRS